MDVHCGTWSLAVLDDNYEETLKIICNKKATDKSRVPIEKDGTLIENNLVSDDWRQEVLDAIDRGAIKKADTLEDLLRMSDWIPTGS